MAGITKRVGEIGAESIHTFPETGERPRKVQALVSGMFTGILYGEKRKLNTYIDGTLEKIGTVIQP